MKYTGHLERIPVTSNAYGSTGLDYNTYDTHALLITYAVLGTILSILHYFLFHNYCVRTR